jgi:hypothetical protein
VTCVDNNGGAAWSLLTNTADKKSWIFWKRGEANIAGKTVTIAQCVGSSTGVLKVFTGVANIATPYTDVVTEPNASGNVTHADFTPTYAQGMVLAFIHNYVNDLAVTNLAFATLGATTMTESVSTGGSDCGTAFGHVLQTGAIAATGALTWTQTNNTTYSTTLVLIPQETALTATAPLVTLTAPTAARTTTITTAAGTQTVTVTAPVAELVGEEEGGTTLEATAPEVTVTAPTATALMSTTLTATAPVLTLTAATATLLAGMVTLLAGTTTVTLTAPEATVSVVGGTETSMADLTTKFAAYVRTVYDAGVGVTANNSTDMTTLFTKNIATVRAANDGGVDERNEVDDANTMYNVHIT